MRAFLLVLFACLLIAPAVAAAGSATVYGDVAGVPFSVGPAPAPAVLCNPGFWYETVDFGVFYSTGYGYGGTCSFYVRAL